MAITDQIASMFAALQRKASSVSNLIVEVTGPGRPVYTQRNFETLAKEGFAGNVYVYRGVLTIGQAAAAVPPKLFREGRKRTEIDQHPILDIMKRPNPMEGGASFWKKVFAFLYLSGNSYLEYILPSSRMLDKIELWTLRPDRMRVILGANFVSGYQYTIGGKSQFIPPEQVLHWKMFNPTDDVYGLSPVVAAGRLIDAMTAANDWNAALLQNYARPPGALVVQSKLDPEQRKNLKGQIQEKYSGGRNAGRPLLLENGMTWLNLGTSPSDMDWLQGKVQHAREIAIAIGVPPELLGDSANKTYSNMQEARKQLYSEVVLPHLYELYDALNRWLVPLFDDSLVLEPDISRIEALQEDQQVKRTFALNSWRGGLLMLNEARKMVDQDEVEGGNVFFIPSGGSIVPEAEIGMPPEPPVQPTLLPIANQKQLPPGSDTSNNANGVVVTEQKRAGMRAYHLWLPRTISRKSARTKESKALHWSIIDAQRERWIPEIKRHVAAMYTDQLEVVKSAISGSQDKHEAAHRVEMAIKSYNDDLSKVLSAIYLHVGNPFARQSYTSLMSEYKRRRQTKGIFDDEDIDVSDSILGWLQNYSALKVQGISDKTLLEVQTSLAGGVAYGESIGDLTKRIENLYLEQIIPNRSEVIARTEVIGASNLGSYIGAKTTGLDLDHEWLATQDRRTRESHSEADGQSVPLEMPFAVGGSQLMFPGDGSLGAEVGEIANCRCTEVYTLAK